MDAKNLPLVVLHYMENGSLVEYLRQRSAPESGESSFFGHLPTFHHRYNFIKSIKVADSYSNGI